MSSATDPSPEEQERIWAAMPDAHLFSDDDRQRWPDDQTWTFDDVEMTEAQFQGALARYRATGERWPSREESAAIARRFYSLRGRLGRAVWRLRWRLRDRNGGPS